MKKYISQKGFTLIEMITVLAIFMLISGVVIFNYGKFRNDTILTNMAYEVALSIREAQIYGVSARTAESGNTPSFEIPYGIYLKEGSNQYYLFADIVEDSKFSGDTCSDPMGDTCVTPYTLQRGVLISDIDISTDSSSCDLKNSVSVLFKRPNPEPIITPGGANVDDISFVQITLTAPDGVTKRYVAIYNNGQVAVVNEPVCN